MKEIIIQFYAILKNEIDLSDKYDSNALYLRKRLGYNSNNIDYCFNGFALKDMLMKNLYTKRLYECPKFIEVLSNYLNDNSIKNDYFRNSKYYLITYKLKINDILFDEKSNLTINKKINYFILQICVHLSDYMYNKEGHLNDNNNPIIRPKDDMCISSEEIFSSEEITKKMLN